MNDDILSEFLWFFNDIIYLQISTSVYDESIVSVHFA